MENVRVAVNGYGVIGKRVADAVAAQQDMVLAGVCDVIADARMAAATARGFAVHAASDEARAAMQGVGIPVAGLLPDLLARADVVVDCTPKRVGAQNRPLYAEAGLKWIVQGGEKHEVTGHSFVAQASWASAVGRESTRVVSCNTTATVRILATLKDAGLVARARGVLLRRATDPWESHLGGIMNTVVPEPAVPSHQGPDARSVVPDLDVVTMACKVPETLGHVHYWWVDLARPTSRTEVLDLLRANPRILLVRADRGLGALNAVFELARDQGRPRGDLYEVAVLEDALSVDGDTLAFCQFVDNQGIVIPETVDAVRALCSMEPDGGSSMAKTDAALGIGGLLPASH